MCPAVHNPFEPSCVTQMALQLYTKFGFREGPMRTRSWLVSAAVMVSTACATRAKEPVFTRIRSDGPMDATLALEVSRRLSPGARARFGVHAPAYALLGQMTDGHVRILFPDEDNPTGRLGSQHGREIGVDTSAGPIFLVVSSKPMELTALRSDTGFVAWRADNTQPGTHRDTIIQRFAADVAGPDVTILRAGARPVRIPFGSVQADPGLSRCRLSPAGSGDPTRSMPEIVCP